MGDVSVEFKQPTVEQGRIIRERSNTFKIRGEGFRQLPLGGKEGRKFFTPLVNPRYREGRKDVSPELGFISKEDAMVDKSVYMIPIYNLLRKKGYPVPATTRYFEKDGHTYLMMTDMTEGGKYKIWGYSDDMSKEQIKDLNSLNLNEDDIAQIQKMALTFADRADKDNITLPYWTYHVRKNLRTGKLDIVFLDLKPEVLKPPQLINDIRAETNKSEELNEYTSLFVDKQRFKTNKSHALEFIDFLKSYLQ